MSEGFGLDYGKAGSQNPRVTGDREAALAALDEILAVLREQAKLQRRLVATLKANKVKIDAPMAFRLDAMADGTYHKLEAMTDVTKQTFDRCPKPLKNLTIPDVHYRQH